MVDFECRTTRRLGVYRLPRLSRSRCEYPGDRIHAYWRHDGGDDGRFERRRHLENSGDNKARCKCLGMVKHIICPKLPPETSPVNLRVDWPVDLADKNLCVEAQFVYSGINLDTNAPWTVENLSRPSFFQTRDVLCGPGPRLSEVLATDPEQFYLWRFAQGTPSSSTKGLEGILSPSPVFADVRAQSLDSRPSGLEFEEGGYRLARLIILRPSPSLKASISRASDLT